MGLFKRFTVTGVATPLNASLVSSTIPALMEQGQNYTVSVGINNTGTVNWTGSDHFALGTFANATGDTARSVSTRFFSRTVIPFRWG